LFNINIKLSDAVQTETKGVASAEGYFHWISHVFEGKLKGLLRKRWSEKDYLCLFGNDLEKGTHTHKKNQPTNEQRN
jgi:hypothetical protein